MERVRHDRFHRDVDVDGGPWSRPARARIGPGRGGPIGGPGGCGHPARVGRPYGARRRPGDLVKKDCCEKPENLDEHRVRPDLIVRVCRVCKCRHFELTMDVGRLGVLGNGIGG